VRVETVEVGRNRPPDDLLGTVLLHHLRLPDGPLPKGRRLDGADVARLAAAGGPTVVVARLEAGDLHEDEASRRLARAVAGPGIVAGQPHESRIDLVAAHPGVLHVRHGTMERINRLDAVEIFSLYHGQAVDRGEPVAAVKVAPHVIPERLVARAEALAEGPAGARPVLDVRPYRALEVGAIATESLAGAARDRFESALRTKLEALGSRLATARYPEHDAAAIGEDLAELVRRLRLPLVLVGGVSAGNPVDPFFVALERLGGRLLRRGVPAHPGSMIWLAAWRGTRILGLPQCGLFSKATAADLLLPRLLTGERVGARQVAELGHGGLLVREMRFRFPAYARDLEAPTG